MQSRGGAAVKKTNKRWKTQWGHGAEAVKRDTNSGGKNLELQDSQLSGLPDKN